MDRNYAHIMRDQDYIILPYLIDKLKIPIFYKYNDLLQNAFLTMLSNNFIIEGGPTGHTNMGGMPYQKVFDCALKNLSKDVTLTDK